MDSFYSDEWKENFLMWNKRKEEEYPLKPATAPSQSVPSKESYPAMSTTPAPSYHPHERGMAVIGKSVMIKGQIISREDLTIDGEVEGSVELQENRLTIGPNGRVQAGVKAREMVVLGAIHGNVETTEKIEIRKDARLVGDIKTARIMIEDGAYFKGSIDIIKPEPAKAPPAPPAPKAQAAAQSQPAPHFPAAAQAVGGNSEPKR